MGERGYLGHIASLLAKALYAQGRLDEAVGGGSPVVAAAGCPGDGRRL